MAGAPDFKVEVPLSPTGPKIMIQPPDPPSFEGAGAGWKALAAAGSELMDIGARIRAAQEQTIAAQKTTEYLTGLDELEREAQKDTDFQNAPKTFGERQRELEMRLVGEIQNPQLRERMTLEWRRAGLAAGKRVHSTSLTREHSANEASLDAIGVEALRSAAVATSDVERASAVSRYENAVKAGVQAGWISPQEAFKREQIFGAQLDDALVVKTINRDPKAALTDLQDPEKFKFLGPLHRQNRINEAAAASDRLTTAELQNTATRDPARAAATVGRVGGNLDADAVWHRMVSPAARGNDFLRERFGNKGVRLEGINPVFNTRLTAAIADAEQATGSKAQINSLVRTHAEQQSAYSRFLQGKISLAARPGTSRHEEGRGEAADIQPGPVLNWLRKHADRYGLEFLPGRAGQIDPVHIQLARDKQPTMEFVAPKAVDTAAEKTRWRDAVTRYDGQLAPAIAAYEVSPEKADRWNAAATEKFGRFFTAQDFLTVVDDDKAKSAIGAAFQRVDAPLNGGGLSPAAQLHAAQVVHSQINQDETERRRSIASIAQVARGAEDPAKVFQAGYDVDPVKYQGWALSQASAAANGDQAAAAALKEAEFQREMLPYRQQALRTAPADLEAFVEAEDARLRAAPDVSIEEKNRHDVFKSVLANVKEARDKNIVGLAEDAGMVPKQQRVNLPANANPGDQDFLKALALRGAQANNAAAFYGGQAIALKPGELAGFKQRWADAGANEKFDLVRAFGATLTGRAFDHTMEAVVGKDPVLQFAARVSLERPELAREIMAGQMLIKAQGEKSGTNVMRGALAATLGGQIYPSVEMQDAVVKSAEALAVARAGHTGVLYEEPDQSTREKAIEDITGPIVKRNGIKLPLPPTMPRADAEDVLNRLSDADIATLGGALDARGQAMPASAITRYGWLRPLSVGGSRYVVDMPSADGRGRPVFAEDGSSLILDLAALARRPRAALPADLSTRSVTGGAMMP